MKTNNFIAIVLAAGKGKRMKSKKSKVLHEIGGKPLVQRTYEILKKAGPKQIIIVASPKNHQAIQKIAPDAEIVIQQKPLGTADAASVGLDKVGKSINSVAILNGDDSAFYKPETILAIFKKHKITQSILTFVTLIKENPTGFGRIVRKNGKLVAIVEEKDANDEIKKIKEINNGLYFFQKKWLANDLPKLSPSLVTGELYVTDLVAMALSHNAKIETYRLVDDSQWHGIDTKEALKDAATKLQKRIHMMGIAGAGASAVAAIAKRQGFDVSGCDLEPESAYRKNLKGIEVSKSHNTTHIERVGALVVSPAVLKSNPNNLEILSAKKSKMPVLTWQQFQGQFLQKDKYVIAIAGGYGKSTTTAMIAKVLIDQGKDPTCEIGATVLEWGTNYRVGKSSYYICEADEYNNNFLNYNPDIAIILNMAWDHPDFFKTESSLLNSYKNFTAKIKKGGYLVIGRDPNLVMFSQDLRRDIKIVKIDDFPNLRLSLIGDFRCDNANAALTVAKILKLDPKIARISTEEFSGTGRRLEYKGKIGDVKVYDDYAVQPYTVLATANALKEKFRNKIVALVFEPHTFTRIETFFDQFVENFKKIKVDHIFITEVYASREMGDTKSLSKRLADSVGPKKATFSGSLTETAAHLKKNMSYFGIICSMGAGNIYKLWDLLKKDG